MAWKTYYIKNRIFELLGLPIDDSNPPEYKPLLSIDEALEIAYNYYGINPGDYVFLDVYDDGVVVGNPAFVRYDDTVETQNRTYYCFRYYWMVGIDYHPSTLGFVYIDAETGVCRDTAP